ncbi:nitrogen permease regulator of amino acid transport activity 3-domain-containing protein [Lasiosphaeria miniovina]|uniref:Nitrogen permease regulator 3 n=1 Tax=Lasiosphaeria miniovina TaxID=1954250 RepID=A0AA40BFN9_9PEZI|nr:nitrogen permease regulator of amino acid transport activity 3-domain-containing protein [Lasiosphaeria miniovina]KAK0733389.1 nitrogen permease regulator of amino acid transport activity 3-domain-containing protein [Lasiosphaeria miniovina]
MALPVLPSSSNVLAVALVINRSRDGPRIVFHYPPHVVPPQDAGTRMDGPSADNVDDDDDDDNDDLLLGSSSRGVNFETVGTSSDRQAADLAQWNHDDHLVTESGTQIVPWEHVAGFPTKDLENILTPARAYHKRLFQVSLDPLLCVSYPVYVSENGVWRKKKRQQQPEPGPPRKDDNVGMQADSTEGAGTGGRGSHRGSADQDQFDAKNAGKAADEPEDKKSSMTMFNLVFLLRPKKHEAKDLVDILFSHIIKKINKAYRYCQQRSDFVWKESKRILILKDKGREDRMKMSLLWKDILSTSSLAASMKDIYNAVSQNKITALQLDTAGGMVTHSVQIPMPFHVSDLPQDSEECQCAGLWLTTANSLMDDDVVDDPAFLDKNFALLLLTDEKKITAELQNDPNATTIAMIEFVHHCKPHLSFHQVGQLSSNVLKPAQVRKFAQHFIFWRRAIAIPPLHARDMYIVSPNCDLRKLPQAAAKWARQFPLAPALPNFLAELSVAPRPYKLHCPGKAHRPLYMAMLAWLMRGGWATQLCTFAYVVVWPEIIYEVDHALEAEEIARARRVQSMSREPRMEGDSKSAPTPAPASVGVSALGDASVAGFGSGFLPLLDDELDLGSPTATTALRDLLLSHPQSLVRSSRSSRLADPPSPDSENSPQSPTLSRHGGRGSQSRLATAESFPPQTTPAEQAAEKARLERLADKAARELAERAMAHSRKALPVQTDHPSVNSARHLAGMSPHIILDAKKATGKESLYLSAIGRRFRDKAAAEAARRGGQQHMDRDVLHNRGAATVIGEQSKMGGPAGMAADGARDSAVWDDRVAKAWPQFCKFFNGKSALERIALQEEMKRKDVWNLLTSMSEYLLCVRHW